MAVSIHNLIAAINPDIYCDPEKRSKVKSLVKEKGYLEAAKEAKPIEAAYADLEEAQQKNPFDKPGQKNPIEQHEVSYDYAGSLEPIYFWLLDYIDKEFDKTEKVIDNFVSASGSAHFEEMQGRATRMQGEAMKIFQTTGLITKSLINLIYSLREFKLRLAIYDDLKSDDKKTRDSAILSLKQIWLDKVDIQKGNTSIKALGLAGANQPNFVMLIESFMAANSKEEVEELALNDISKRILLPRIAEFQKWLTISEKELRKRYEIERLYLRNQVSTLKLYARWVKPYLKAAKNLEQRAEASAALVTAFNTALFELTLLGMKDYKPEDDIRKEILPEMYRTLVEKKKIRKYTPLVIAEVKFRSVPGRIGQQGGYTFRGKLDLTFTSYALNDEELETLKKEVERDDLGDLMEVIEGSTEKSLEIMKDEIDEFLNEEDEAKKQEEKQKEEDVNPFSALFSFLSFGKKEDKKEKSGVTIIAKDSDYEIPLRSQAILQARSLCVSAYDSFKKAYNIPAF